MTTGHTQILTYQKEYYPVEYEIVDAETVNYHADSPPTLDDVKVKSILFIKGIDVKHFDAYFLNQLNEILNTFGKNESK